MSNLLKDALNQASSILFGLMVFCSGANAQYKIQYIDPQVAPSFGNIILSDNGSVYGNLTGGTFDGVPFQWTSGRTSALTSIPTDRTPFQISAANSSGVLTGSIGKIGDQINAAAVWTENSLIYLDSPGRYNYPVSINDNGISVGQVELNRVNKAAIWNGSTFSLLPDLYDLNGESHASSINLKGTIVGVATDSRGKVAAYWDEFGVHSIGRIGPCESGGSESIASDINSFGQIVGTASVGCAGRTKAFLFRDSSIRVLDTFGQDVDSAATAINDNGSIVGHINGSAVIWKIDGGPRLLTDLLESSSGFGEISLNYALAINSSGQILANPKLIT